MSVAKITAIAQLAAEYPGASLQKQVESFIAQARMLADGGLSLGELGQLLLAFTQMAVRAAETLKDATGADKRAYVLEAVSYLYEVLAPAIPLPWFLNPFRRLLREPVRQIVLAIAQGAIEVFVVELKA